MRGNSICWYNTPRFGTSTNERLSWKCKLGPNHCKSHLLHEREAILCTTTQFGGRVGGGGGVGGRGGGKGGRGLSKVWPALRMSGGACSGWGLICISV